MKILHIINSLGKGGAEKLLVDSLPTIIGHSISILVLSSKDEEMAYRTQLENSGIQYYSLGNNSVRSPIIFGKLFKFLNKKIKDFDVIHVHLFPALYYVSLASVFYKQHKKLTWLFTEHSTQNKRAGHSLFRPIEKWIYQHYDAIIAISPKVKIRLEGLLNSKDKIRLIRNGVDISGFKNAQALSHEEVNIKFGVDDKAVILLMTARFKYPKDQDTLIKSLAFLPPSVHVFLAGVGVNSRIDSVKALASNEGVSNRVHFLGFRTDVPCLMKTATINILSSNYEGMSGVTLEAMASGTPFLGSDVPGINDVVPDARFLFERGNSKVLAAKIQQIIDNPILYEKMSMSGISYVNQFAMTKMVKNYLSLYTELLSKK